MATPSSKNPYLTLGTKKFVDYLASQDAPPLYTLSPEQARQVLIDTQAATPVSKPDVDIEDLDFPVGPTGKVSMRIIRPKGCTEKLPIIFYIHGGGWIMGNKETHDNLVRHLAVGSKAAVVYPNYTPSPEAQYPQPIEECYAALCYTVENADKYNLDASKLAVCGDSAGGNMATVMTIMSKQRNGPKIICQVLLYPVTVAAFDTDSYDDFADGPWLTKKAMEWFWDAYAPDSGNQRKEITVSPLLATCDDLKGLPPALIIVDQNDVLRDEGEAYARKLIEAGVKVACVRYNGTHHDFMMLNALADTAPTKEAILQTVATFRKAFYCKSATY